MQMILGTVSLHGVAYDGYVINTEDKYKLLNKDAYEEVSSFMKPYFAKLIQPISETRCMVRHHLKKNAFIAL
jgi:hypothetical protein